ncbi:two-component system response regulator RegX3 [Arcanobacterium pluranimalium]|uniref:response regulator transcription factor n=1 Tax=Arcanobacterium pluranimalium TaxID=108028 RepID=UPI00195EA2B6|nr:response regulator transcription factor [Arcanobacterium pluranimalium]MBM7824588.1 two-component system response regulator RegX3 [Arcanobacterium pluranimalium]
MTTILLVEDEPTYRETLAFNLGRDGYDVIQAENGLLALERFAAAEVDLVILDLMLPKLSGTEVCRKIRQDSQVPIIMLTAKDAEIDKVVGLELGADDYVTKPYSYRELLARVRALLRRTASTGDASSAGEQNDVLCVGGIEMNIEAHEVRIAGELVSMPLREFELLEYLMENPDRVLTRSQILDRIWGIDYIGDTKTLDVHVKRIRTKIEEDPAQPKILVTVRGLGYKLVSGQ